jgi:anti-anti-sigma regulatory factor
LLTKTAQQELERVLGEVHSHIVAAKIASFTVDVRLLNFVNSSALRVFINWISRAERVGYKLVFVTDPRVTWHRLNFSVLKSLAPQSVEVVYGNGLGAESGIP